MPYEPRLPPGTRDSIERYVERFDTLEQKLEAIAQIQGALEALARNPRLGVVPRGAFGFPIYTFTIRIEDVSYPIRASYFYSDDEKAIIVTGVNAQLL